MRVDRGGDALEVGRDERSTKTCAPNDRTFVFGSSFSEMGTPSAYTKENRGFVPGSISASSTVFRRSRSVSLES